MKIGKFMGTLRGCILFLLILAGLLLGFALADGLVGAASFRHPWTWILPFAGLAVFDGIIRVIYKKSPLRDDVLRIIRKKYGKQDFR